MINKRKKVLSAEEKEFIQKNRDFWASFTTRDNGQKILVEEPLISYITHVNSIFTVILNQAKSYTPVWLHSRTLDIEFLKSYIPTAEHIKIQKLSQVDKLRVFIIAVRKFIAIYKSKDILSCSYDRVKYGDLIYDNYLMQKHVGTIKKIDLNLLLIIYACIHRHECVRKTLQSDNFEAVLVSHQVGISPGVMLRTALRYGYKGYLRAGQYQSTLQCFENVDEVYDYEYKPFPADIDAIINGLGPEFDHIFNTILNQQLIGKGNADTMRAFSPKNKLFTDRESFGAFYGLDIEKKNVFVMLHALNDYPHSHFRWMIFKDYYEWFVETLSFARTFNKVNWIFKQHPSIKFYQTKDVSFNDIFRDCPKNIIYISEENQINARSMICCADVVITCLGSAGFELPAMVGIPSIVAGDNHYSNLGFAQEPTTKKQYFDFLNNVHILKPLTPEQQKRAQAAYMYIYKFSSVNVSACPELSLEEQNDSNINDWYWSKVEEFYNTRKEMIKYEIRTYVNEVGKPGFKRLNSLQKYRELIQDDAVQSN